MGNIPIEARHANPAPGGLNITNGLPILQQGQIPINTRNNTSKYENTRQDDKTRIKAEMAEMKEDDYQYQALLIYQIYQS